MKKLAVIMLETILFAGSFYVLCFAQDNVSIVHKGNLLYQDKKYDAALKLYNEAQIKSPDSLEIDYNIGVAQFKKGDYNLAVSSFEKATMSADKILESKVNFNIGNSKYKLGKLKENTDLSETINLLRQALDYYKRTIELNVKDQDARINHELVEKELKILLDKSKQEQDKQKEEAQDKNKEEKQSAEQKQASASQEQKTEEQKQKEAQEAAKQNEAQEEKQAKLAQEQKAEQGQESKASQQQEAKEMSKQEAQMLLEGYRQEEGSAQKSENKPRGYLDNVAKDW